MTLRVYAQQELFDNDHRVVSQRGSASGRFTFSAADAGEHRLCFTPSSNSGRQNWLSVLSPNGGIKLRLDLAIGETSEIESTDKSKMQDIVQRVRDLNSRLQDIRREQVFQRVCGLSIYIRLFCPSLPFSTLPRLALSCLVHPRGILLTRHFAARFIGEGSRVQRPVRNHE